MKKFYVLAIVISAVLLCFWWRNGGSKSQELVEGAGNVRSDSAAGLHSDEPISFKTKVRIRERLDVQTHSPERLKDFMLPAMRIDGLDLRAALDQLMVAYRDACRISGEKPLPLVFNVPPGDLPQIRIDLGNRNLNASVRLLAGISGMQTSRTGLEYRFTPIEDGREQSRTVIAVDADVRDRVSSLAGKVGEEGASAATLADGLAAAGIELDPSTTLKLQPDGTVVLETMSQRDEILVAGFLRVISETADFKHQYSTMFLDLPAGSELKMPESNLMAEDEFQLYMRQAAMTVGTVLTTLPKVTAASNSEARTEFTKDLKVPLNPEKTEFENLRFGIVMTVTGSGLAFGHETKMSFSDTKGGVDPVTGRAVIEQHVDVKDSGYSSDGGNRANVYRRPDGSRTIVLQKTRLVDSTGLPIQKP